MKTTLFLSDETVPPTLLLQNAAFVEAKPREAENLAGRDCDRWGHPCLRHAHRGVDTKPDFPTKSPAKK